MNNPRMRVNKEGDIESPSHGNFTSLAAASFTASVGTFSANFSTLLAARILAFSTCFRTSITNVGTKTSILAWHLHCYEQSFDLLKHRCLRSHEGFLDNQHILLVVKIHNTHQNTHYMLEHTYYMPRDTLVGKCSVDSQ